MHQDAHLHIVFAGDPGEIVSPLLDGESLHEVRRSAELSRQGVADSGIFVGGIGAVVDNPCPLGFLKESQDFLRGR